MSTEIEIWVVPFFGQGHLFPCMELCKHFASRNCKSTLIVSSNISSTIPSSFHQHPLVQVAEIPSSPPAPPEPGSNPLRHHWKLHGDTAKGVENLLSARSANGSLPVCAVFDVMMGWTGEIFGRFGVPTIGFFTSGACSAALEYALWKAHPLDLKPGETRLLPGLPEEMALTYSDLKRRPHGPPGGFPPGPPGGPGGPAAGSPPGAPGAPGPRMMGPPKPGQQPPWMEEAKGSIALMINTCDDLERPFIDYLADQIKKPVWGVGPLLPEQFWKSAHSLLHDREIRTNRRSNVTEDEVIEWLDSKPQGSVLYVSFGSEVSPSNEEFDQLARALEESDRPFIWVLQLKSVAHGPPPQLHPGTTDARTDEAYFPTELAAKVGNRGLIIKGWAPQLMILSHPSTGGFLSHCGWNSTVEAIGRGIPILAWPIRGDQFSNAKLVTSVLKTGYMVAADFSESVEKEHIAKGIELLMSDPEMKKSAEAIAAEFGKAFPPRSVAALDAFKNFITSPK